MMASTTALQQNPPAAQPASALFGQSGALYLLQQCGGRASLTEICEYMDTHCPGAMSRAMLCKAYSKLRSAGVITYETPGGSRIYQSQRPPNRWLYKMVIVDPKKAVR